MSALAIAMLLTGAGGLETVQQPLPVPVPMMPPPTTSASAARRPQLLNRHFIDYFTPADYPDDALPLGGHAYVGFGLSVGPDGRVATRMITVASGSPALDQATCRVVLERARYRPALDAAGRPVNGRHGGGVIWQAPSTPGASASVLYPSPPPPPHFTPPQRARANLTSYFSVDDYPAAALHANAQGTTRVRMTIGPDGRIANCVVTGSSGSPALDEATCLILTSRARYTPARDAMGNPATGIDDGHVIWRLPTE